MLALFHGHRKKRLPCLPCTQRALPRVQQKPHLTPPCFLAPSEVDVEEKHGISTMIHPRAQGVARGLKDKDNKRMASH